MIDLKDRVALVTGASRGIGRAIALALADAGAAVAVSAAVQAMKEEIEERLGSIGILVNNAGMAQAHGTGSISVAYNASKAGLEGLTRGYAGRVAAQGITVNAIAPGLIDTDMGKPLIEAGVAGRIPAGRVGRGEEIAQAVMLLVADAFITGQTLAVNGGGLFS